MTPAAAARQVSASTRTVAALSVVFAVVATAGGILLALGSAIPISPYITTLSFLIWGVCRALGKRRHRRGWAPRPSTTTAPSPDPHGRSLAYSRPHGLLHSDPGSHPDRHAHPRPSADPAGLRMHDPGPHAQRPDDRSPAPTL